MARMGRPPIKRKAMTPAERVRRHREAKKKGISLRPSPVTESAKATGYAPGSYSYVRSIQRGGIPELSALIGKIGVNLLARLARNTRKNVQRRFVAILEAEGPRAARAYAKERIARGRGR